MLGSRRKIRFPEPTFLHSKLNHLEVSTVFVFVANTVLHIRTSTFLISSFVLFGFFKILFVLFLIGVVLGSDPYLMILKAHPDSGSKQHFPPLAVRYRGTVCRNLTNT